MGRRRPSTVHGVAVVDKPAGMTSHDVVAVLRRRSGERRIGHSGTLDPPATGVLVCGAGRATRLLPFVTSLPKTYVAEIVLGVATTTLDDTGDVVATAAMAPSRDEVVAAAAALTGAIVQVPPMVSAVKVGGRRLHELAREGVEVQREARPVTVHRFEVTPTADASVWAVEVECSSGTYVRTLAADLGALLGGVAHLRGLRRTAVGSFTVAEATPPEDAIWLPVVEAMRDYPRVRLPDAELDRVRHGAPFDPAWMDGAPVAAVVDGAGELVAVYRLDSGRAAAAVVLAAG
jgi:tRNA pseudouridine55 synthase